MGVYEPISTTTFGSTTSSLTISSIPQTYKHLILVVQGKMAGEGGTLRLRFNGDTGNNYCGLYVERATDNTNYYAIGSEVASIFLYGASQGYGPEPLSVRANIMNYVGSTYKMMLSDGGQGAPNGTGRLTGLNFMSGLWKSTSAITSITLTPDQQFASGCSVTLWGL